MSGTLDDRLGRREIQQRPHRGPGALERARLERLGDGEHEDDRRRLGPLAEGNRTGGRDEHQHVDVERPRAHRQPGLARRQRDASGNGGGEEQPGHERRVQELGEVAGGRGRARRDEQRAAPAGARLVGRDRLLVLEPGAHPGVGDGVGDRGGRELRRVVLDVQPLGHHVRGEGLDARQRLEAALDERHLFAAVHALDLERRFGVQLADRAGGHGYSRGRPRPLSCTCSSPCSNRRTMC